MTKFTKERLEWFVQISSREEIEDIDGSEIRDLARIALASFAPPIGYTDAEELRSADNDIWMWKSPHGFGNDIPLYAAPRPASRVSVMYKDIELLTIDGLELIRDGMAEPTGLEAMCMAKALLSAPPTPAVMQNHHKWSPGLVHPEDCQCGDCRSAKLNHQSSNSFTDEDLEMMAHGNNPQSNAYRELLAFRRNSQWIGNDSTNGKPLTSGCIAANSPVTPDTWIPVSERMPEVGDIVLTAIDGCVNVGEAERSGANYRYFTSVISGRELPATHWQPLPEPPKEVG